MCQAPVVMRASAQISYATQNYCAPRERESLWPLIRVFETGAIRARAGPKEESSPAITTRRAVGVRRPRHSSRGVGQDSAGLILRLAPRPVGNAVSGGALGLPLDASRTLSIVEPA